MAMTGVKSFDQSLNKTNEWLKDIQEKLGLENNEDAYSAFRAVIHTLRDRLTAEEAADLASQLPMILAGVYYDGWKPGGMPVKINTEKEFYESVAEKLKDKGNMNPVEITKGVLRVLGTRISGGEIRDIKSNLPPELHRLFPEWMTSEDWLR